MKDNDEYVEEEYIIKKVKKLRFYAKDYMSCKETKDILLTNWRDKFSNSLEEKIDNIFKHNYVYMKQTSANILSRAEKYHASDLVSLIKHHIVKDYDISVFMDNPDLANELLENFNDIKQKRNEEIKKQHAKALSKSNKNLIGQN